MDEEGGWSQGGACCVAAGGGREEQREKGGKEGRRMGLLLQQVQVLLYTTFELRISGKRYCWCTVSNRLKSRRLQKFGVKTFYELF